MNAFNSSISHNEPERKGEDGYCPRRSVSGEHFDRARSAKASPNLIGSDLSPSDYIIQFWRLAGSIAIWPMPPAFAE